MESNGTSALNAPLPLPFSISNTSSLSTSNTHSFSGLHFWIRESTQNGIFQIAQKSFDNCNNRIFTETPLEAQKPSVYHTHSGKHPSLHRGSIFLINEVVARLVEVKGRGINQKQPKRQHG